MYPTPLNLPHYQQTSPFNPMTLQEAETKVRSFVDSLTPKYITYSNVTLTLTLGDTKQEQVECKVYQSNQAGTVLHETFKASSISRLMGKIEGELRDHYQPEALEEIHLEVA